ncbi:MAG: chromate transporter [Chloroflexota bacterium]|nr:chromate efflux transporter [Ardenticatenaceae bacterium]GIK57081.1 MAG: chromate transporter [Chloroflexota bacterium]
MAQTENGQTAVTFREALRVWVRIAIYSFGGPAGQMAVMHRLVVEEKKWVSEARFLHALNYAMLLPGPEAQQLVAYLGWLLHGVKGGLAAGLLFILPGFLSILALSILYAQYQDVTFVQAIFYGLKPAVMAVVAEAVLRIGRRALKNRVLQGIAALAFVAIFFFNALFPLIIMVAGLVGLAAGRRWGELFGVRRERDVPDEAVIDDASALHARPSLRRAIITLFVCLLLWFAPLLLLWLAYGDRNALLDIGLFFSRAAVVTFGGAYAVLAYIAQQAVDTYGWLQPGEMLDGLGMAETTPGPLIQVVQFVGFMGAYRHPGAFSPLAAGVMGAVLTTWVTFVPCFLWIFLGAPYIESLRGRQSLTTALMAITAAVVGVILNLAVWFSLNVIFGTVNEVYWGPLRLYVPDWSTIDGAALLMAIAAFLTLFRFKVSMLWTLAGAAVAGLVVYLVRAVG